MITTRDVSGTVEIQVNNYRRATTAKVIHCGDMGCGCDFVVRGETMEEVLKVGVEHGKEVHEMNVTPDMLELIKGMVRDE